MSVSTTAHRRHAPVPARHRLGLPRSLADFERRRFRLDRPAERAVLEGHARAFLDGFDLAARHWRDPHTALSAVPAPERGFAYEGAGMHAAVRDTMTAGRAGALGRLLDGPGQGYVHLVHVGYGWAPALLRLPLPVPLPPTPLLRWLALDGAGFAETFFGGRAALRHRTASRRTGQRWAARVAGCGRALWFLESAHVEGVVREVAAAPPAARPHLWSGVGLAATYAGCAGPDEVTALLTAAGLHGDHVRQGVMFGVTARTRSGVVPAHTSEVAWTALGAAPEEIGRWTDEAAAGLVDHRHVEAYDTWKARLRAKAAARRVVAR